MINSCSVIVANELLSSDDVTYAAKPKVQLRAVPFRAASKQIVRSVGDTTDDTFSVFDASTGFPANITGMAMFLTITDKSGACMVIKGKVKKDSVNLVSFGSQDLVAGFYSYNVSVKANDYTQRMLEGSYVVRV